MAGGSHHHRGHHHHHHHQAGGGSENGVLNACKPKLCRLSSTNSISSVRTLLLVAYTLKSLQVIKDSVLRLRSMIMTWLHIYSEDGC